MTPEQEAETNEVNYLKDRLEIALASKIFNLQRRFFNAVAKDITANDLLIIHGWEYQRSAEKQLNIIYKRAALVFARWANDRYGNGEKHLHNDFVEKDFFNDIYDLIAGWLGIHALENSETQKNTIVRRARQIVAGAFHAGKSEKETALLLRKAGVDEARVRAETIARVEVSRATDEATRKTIDQLGIKVGEKTWLAGVDGVTRATHRNVTGPNGETGEIAIAEVFDDQGNTVNTLPVNAPRIKAHEYFNVGGHLGLEPRDAALPFKEIVNCRCHLLRHT